MRYAIVSVRYAAAFNSWPLASTLTARSAPSSELAAELQQFVRERLAEYKRPRWVEFLPELPKTATGKIQRFRLRQKTETLG